MIPNKTMHRIRVNVFNMALFFAGSLSRTISMYTWPRSIETLGILKPITIASDNATIS